jgi:cobyrinic acid a,c-diamide synthase
LTAPVIIVAAPQSGSGKTLVTLGLIRALKNRGLEVASFKTGPDYIDPAFHARASGRPCRNLDSWAMRLETLAALLDDTGRGVDVVIGEGVMGLFDGAPDGTGSTADLAALLGVPVLLVVDARRMAQSVAPLVEGFLRFRSDVAIDAIVLNATGSERHRETLLEACHERFSTPVLGCLPRVADLELPSRHLGLVQAAEHADLEAFIERAAGLVAAHLDLDRLLRLARRPTLDLFGPGGARPWPALGQRIAVASDPAFAFAYPAVLEGWHRQGATVHPFSPLADEAPDPAADAVYLPGGYPELHAGTLAAASGFLAGLQAAAARGAFVYGECGGYMVLGRQLTDRDGIDHAMAGLLPVATSFAAPRLHLGYRRLTLLEKSPLGARGLPWRGHEFHYASETECLGQQLFAAGDARGRPLGPTGCRHGTVAGSFAHLIDRHPALGLVP